MDSELPDYARALMDPKIYQEPPEKVELMQTQMSFIFIAGDYVYKVKKPVNLGYLDYSTLEQRLFFCRKEVELNRRLSPDVYLRIVSINKDKNEIHFEGKGDTIEYAVKMRNLPQDKMLNVLLNEGKVSDSMITSVARKIAEFHLAAENNAAINEFGSLETIRTNATENFDQTVKYITNTISQKTYREIMDYTNGFIDDNAAVFESRVTAGKIRDCHGDLHAAHICFLDDSVSIYDCIEFNDRFRYGDVASEIAFLAMDLDRYGRCDLSQKFVNDYVSFSQDEGLNKVLDFYKCYRAYVRGKVESFMLDDPLISVEQKEKISAAARKYFELAESYI